MKRTLNEKDQNKHNNGTGVKTKQNKKPQVRKVGKLKINKAIT